MPQILKIGPYWIYFGANENKPLEPIHVHIAEGRPVANSTKVWITQTGKCLLCNNLSGILEKKLNKIIRVIEANSEEVIGKWKEFFGEVRYFC